MDLNNYLAKSDGTTIKQHINDLQHCLEVIKNIGYIKSEHLYWLINLSCIYHDYGKVNKEFQKRVKSIVKKAFDVDKEIAHNVLSIYFINKDDFDDYNDYLKLVFAVGFHHNYCDVLSVLSNIDKRKLIVDLLDDFEIYKPNIKTRNSLPSVMLDKESILLKGFLHKCDYCASAGCLPEIENDFLCEKVESLGYNWNNMQKYCQDNTNENIIVVAQTGMGKTEGALKWIGNNKGFFVLPLKTAINAMYERISENIIKEDVENKLAVLHSESINYLINNIQNEEIDIIEYNQKGRKLSMPLTVTTMDQLFDFVFRYNGYEMKLTTFSYSKIVIDEIQMYGAELLAYLIYGIKKIIEFGGKVAIVTATLSPFIRDLLGDSFKYNEFIDDSLIRHNVCVKKSCINKDDIINKYYVNKTNNKSNKILVICNTIKKAQELYDEIISDVEFEDEGNINLFHTRFTKDDRADKEKNILNVGSTNENLNQIWITTSVVEASLDIDFDYLFTELQDINSLFQRLGRCNRKGKKSVDDYNCFVYTEINPKIIRWKNSNTGFIDETIYNLSKEAVLNIDGILTESKKLELLNTYFTIENLKNSDFMRDYEKYYKNLDDIKVYNIDPKKVELRHIESIKIIPKSLYENKKSYFDNLVKDIENERNSLRKIKLMDELNGNAVDIPYYEFNNSDKVSIKI
ncbi:MAG: CRISPR-associated helicase Cas3', partial [Lachnospirales bacterium]